MEIDNLIREKIKSNVGNIAVIAAFNIGFAFFEYSIFLDVAVLALLSFGIYKWNSRVCSFLVLALGLNAFYFQISNIYGVGGWRIVLILWWLYSGTVLTFYTTKFHRSGDTNTVNT